MITERENIKKYVTEEQYSRLSEYPESDIIIVPSFTDVHVHLREPGFFYKETIKTGTEAAAVSGYSHVFSMPNLNPVPDCLENLKEQLDIINRDSYISVIPYGSITKGERGFELSELEEIAPFVCGFSDDGVGLNNEELMRDAMFRAKKLNKVIAAHCEDMKLRNIGYIHEGEYARLHGHAGISSESEWKPIERDIRLARETGCKFHVCHISTKESVELIRKAKNEGIDISCETAPHYLILNDMCLEEDGRFKMNPPIRSEEDRLALVEGLKDGTIDMIATDHAPHSVEEKSKGLRDSAMGIVGLETCFPIMYSNFVKKGIISLEKLVELMSANPRRRFGLDELDRTENFSVWEVKNEYEIKPESFKSMGRATPFTGMKVYGRCILSVVDGFRIHENI